MEEIILKLKELSQKDKGLNVFGSASHEYALNDPISEERLEQLEDKYSCNFPLDYRSFLTVVGNGGAGPFYGVFPIEMQDDNYDMCGWGKGCLVGDLSKPFSYDNEWNLPSEYWENEPNLNGDETEEEEDKLWEAWDKQIERDYWAPNIMNGAIPICHQGCAIRTWLVVSGSMKGTVWDDYRCDREGIAPLKNKDGSNMSFTDWYLNWLNESLEEVEGA